MPELIISLLVIIVPLFILFKAIRIKEDLKRSKNLVFLKITMPKKESDLDEKKETTKDFKEMIGLMEQLFSSLKSIHSSKISRKILWQDIISCEYIAHEWEIYFYVVVPKKYKYLIEKQINGFYTDALVEEEVEIDIFKWKSYSEWTYINTTKDFLYPIKTYQILHRPNIV